VRHDNKQVDASAADPHAWLEEVEGQQQLAWVRERNQEAQAALGTERFASLQAGVLEILDAKEKIPHVTKHGGWLYNHWTDAEHERGLWRRTTPESFASGEPEWEVLLDLDALGEREGVNWVWHGASLLPHD